MINAKTLLKDRIILVRYIRDSERSSENKQFGPEKEEVSVNKNPKSWDKQARPGLEKISFLNLRSLINKFENIRADWSLLQSKIMILGETWIPTDMDQTEEYEIEGFDSHMNNSGRGRGLAVFQKQGCIEMTDHNAQNINVTKLEGTELNIIAVYRSQEGSFSRLIEILQNIIVLIMGG